MIFVILFLAWDIWYLMVYFRERRLFGGYLKRKQKKQIRKMVKENKSWEEIETYITATSSTALFRSITNESVLRKIKANIELGLIKWFIE